MKEIKSYLRLYLTKSMDEKNFEYYKKKEKIIQDCVQVKITLNINKKKRKNICNTIKLIIYKYFH